MSTLEGRYRSNFDPFSISIIQNTYEKDINEYEFRLLNQDNSEEFLYKGLFFFGTISNIISVTDKNVKISCQSDFSVISIEKFPRIGFKGNYT